MDIRTWWSEGTREQLAGHHVWVRSEGSGPWMTLLHGFPSSAHDFWKVWPALAEGHRLLTLDLLGFGASDKPAGHDYSLLEQTDLVEGLWERFGVDETIVVAHDYSVSIAEELLSRRAPIARLHLLNGGLYPGVHRPTPGQFALLDPEQGPQLNAAMNEDLMVLSLRETFAADYDHAEDARAIWASNAEGGGPVLDRTIRYMTDRVEHAERWTGALEATDVPTSYVWGMLDPISGAHMAEQVRSRMPGARIAELHDVGHWPMLEAPDRVASAILAG